MKRVSAIVLAIILASLCCVSAVSAMTDGNTLLYKSRFCAYYDCTEEALTAYEELYEHKNTTGDTDWVLLYAKLPVELDVTYSGVIGNRVFIQDNEYVPFTTGYGIYDVTEDRFVDIANPYDFDGSNYPGYDQAIDAYGFTDADGSGRPVGDIDKDDSISIIDATLLQRCEVKLRDYPEDDAIGVSFGNLQYYSDFNRDGARDIVDATCIQRYLVGAYYPSVPVDAKPKIKTISFEDINNVYDHNQATVTAVGEAPLSYCYTIRGSFHAYSQYGDDFGEYHLSDEYFEPGEMIFTTGYIDRNVTAIPTHSITYGDTFELTVTVKDASGRESDPVTVMFDNH